jgi:D-alanine-D-alanine ligase
VAWPEGCEAAFIALHGTFGEDGQLQALLEARGIPFTGSGSGSSRTSFDKVATKRILERQGIATPRYEVLAPGQARTLPLPVVVKPPRQGSSIGISKVFEESAWPAALDAALKLDTEALVETFHRRRGTDGGRGGRAGAAHRGNSRPEGYYDYRAKYTKG